MSNTKVTVIGQICQTIDKMQPLLEESLKGTGISVERFVTTAKTAIQMHPQKDRLEQADRDSLYIALKKSAAEGLMPDGREAALVVYAGKVQYQPMVQGLVKLARNSGEIENISSEVVFDKDEFEFYYDFNGTKFKHIPNWKGSRGEPVLVWASVKLKSGEIIARAYPKERIMQIATRSKLPKNYQPEEGLDWEEFWRKAAIRNVLKYAPRTTALERAIEEWDGLFGADGSARPQYIQDDQEDRSQKQERKRTTRAADVVKETRENNQPDIIDAEVLDVETGEIVAEDQNINFQNEEIPI
jgi:recombination protein RecT